MERAGNPCGLPIIPGPPSGLSCGTRFTPPKKMRRPLDKKSNVIYDMATSMEIISRWTGRRRKRCQPTRQPDASRFTHHVLPRRSIRAKAGSRTNPLSPQNWTFSLQFPLHILKTHTSNRCRSTTYAKCLRKLSNSLLTLTPESRRRPGNPMRHNHLHIAPPITPPRPRSNVLTFHVLTFPGPLSPHKYTVSTPFLHRFSIHFSPSHFPLSAAE
jgi:hypothetical protein